MPGVVRFEENTLPVVVLGVLCDFLLGVSAALIIGWMGFLSLRQLAIYSMLVWKQRFLFLGTPCASGRPRIINNGEVVCSLSRRGQTVESYGIA
jgi:hypothetical protein